MLFHILRFGISQRTGTNILDLDFEILDPMMPQQLWVSLPMGVLNCPRRDGWYSTNRYSHCHQSGAPCIMGCKQDWATNTGTIV